MLYYNTILKPKSMVVVDNIRPKGPSSYHGGMFGDFQGAGQHVDYRIKGY